MGDKVLCDVCNTELKDFYCPYCGYDAANLTDDEEHSTQYKKELISKINALSADIQVYKYDEKTNELKKIGNPKSLFGNGVTGERCYQGIIKSEEWIAHCTGKTNIEINYEFGGKKKTATGEIVFPDKKGVWYFYLYLNKELRLEVGLIVMPIGDEKQEEKRIPLTTLDLELVD